MQAADGSSSREGLTWRAIATMAPRRSGSRPPAGRGRVGPGSPEPSRDRPVGGRPPAFLDDGPGDPAAGRGEEEWTGQAGGGTEIR
jgi:hypothetical protein